MEFSIKYDHINIDFFLAPFLPVKSLQFMIDWANEYMPYWFIVIMLPVLSKVMFVIPTIIRTQKKFEEIMHKMPDALMEFQVE